MKPIATSNNGLADNYHSEVATMFNITGYVALSEYDEYLSQISLTEDDSMIELVSKSELSQEVVGLATQDPAPVAPREELLCNDGELPLQENIIYLVYHLVVGQAIERTAQGLFLFEEKPYSISFLLQLQREASHPRHMSITISKQC